MSVLHSGKLKIELYFIYVQFYSLLIPISTVIFSDRPKNLAKYYNTVGQSGPAGQSFTPVTFFFSGLLAPHDRWLMAAKEEIYQIDQQGSSQPAVYILQEEL